MSGVHFKLVLVDQAKIREGKRSQPSHASLLTVDSGHLQKPVYWCLCEYLGWKYATLLIGLPQDIFMQWETLVWMFDSNNSGNLFGFRDQNRPRSFWLRSGNANPSGQNNKDEKTSWSSLLTVPVSRWGRKGPETRPLRSLSTRSSAWESVH